MIEALVSILSLGIAYATPYLYAGLGETFGQRSGVLNLGVEGQMLMGAFAAFYITLVTGSPWQFALAAALTIGGIAIVGVAHGLINAPVVTHVADTGVAARIGAGPVAAAYRFLERLGHVLGPVIVALIMALFEFAEEIVAEPPPPGAEP